MKFEKPPQPNPAENPEPEETKSPERASEITPESEKRESIVLNFDAIRNIIISQIGDKAKIERLEIKEVAGGAKLSAEIDAGMLGGRILIDGLIVNTSNEITISDLNIDARGYVKSKIKNSLSSFGPAIKKYFERQYGKLVSNINITGSNLIIEFENKKSPHAIKKDSPEFINEIVKQTGQLLEDDKFEKARTTIIERISDPRIRDEYLENIDENEEMWYRKGAQRLVYENEFDKARAFVEKIKNEKVRGGLLKDIDRIETNRCKKEAQRLINEKRFDEARIVIKMMKDEEVKNLFLDSLDRIEKSRK